MTRSSLVALALIGSACRVVAGVDDRSGKSMDAEASAGLVLDWIGPGCAACAEAKCPDRVQACSASPDCVAMNDCVRLAPSPGGFATCATELPAGLEAFHATGDCLVQSCAEECDAGQHWSCLGDSWDWPSPPPRNLEVTVRLEEVGGAMPISGATVKACRATDSTCGAGAGEQASGTTADDGSVALTLPTLLTSRRVPWDGFFDISGVDLHPELRYLEVPLGWDGRIGLGVFTKAFYSLAVDQFAAAAGHPVDAGRGVITVDTKDCAFFLASGVALEVDPADGDTRYGYVVDGLRVDPNQKETSLDGIAVAVNVLPGTVTITLRRAATNEVIAERGVFVRAGTRTAMFMVPTSSSR